MTTLYDPIEEILERLQTKITNEVSDINIQNELLDDLYKLRKLINEKCGGGYLNDTC